MLTPAWQNRCARRGLRNEKRNIMRDYNESDDLLEDEPIKVPDVAPAFAEGGPIARALGKRYRHRPGQVEMAQLRLTYTSVTAPADGFVTRMSAEIGNTVQAGQPLMSLVSLDDAFVVANYKETRIERILPGQKVTMKIDAYPGLKFTGRVDSIMAGTGASFTLFPPENASGNYVKVVQRVPVKITFDNLEKAKPYLRIGLSVVPTILTEE